MPTVREPGGLAMSSRNAYLDPGERRAALALSRALGEVVRGARRAGDGPTAGMLRDLALVTLHAEPGLRLDYLEVHDLERFEPPDARRGQAPDHTPERSGEEPDARPRWLVAVAAYVGQARLIDNVVVGDRDDEDRLLAALEPG